MYEVDLQKFWRDDEIAHQDNCFYPGPQVALGIRMSSECVYAELGEEGNPWVPEERARAIDLYRRYNDKAEKIVGCRLLNENFLPEDAQFPYVKRIGEVFGGTYSIRYHTEWLTECFDDEDQLARKLDEVRRMDMRAFMLPSNWAEEKKRIYETYGLKPPLMRHIRGPVTLACSLFGSENFLFLILDNPDLARKFSDTITWVTLEMARVMDEEAGVNHRTRRGFSFADDNCCLLNTDMYELFGYPVLRDVFAHYSPAPDDSRYQHSDSDMGHLLPILGKLDLTGVNFGPNVLVPEIRQYLPRARIDGCIAPFTFMRNEEEELTRQVLRDIQDGLTYGGVNISTAGSINNGSLLTSMRQIMSLIQQYPRAGA
jgi:uroporphyrinogen decarboxylase